MLRNEFLNHAIRLCTIWGVCIGLLLFSVPGFAAATDRAAGESIKQEPTSAGHHAFSFYIENDSFISGDRQYTSGLKVTWSRFGLKEYPDNAYLFKWLYPVVRLVGFGTKPDTVKALSVSVGQSIYTPDDLTATKVIPDDRPYAGITYAELGFHRQRDDEMDTLELMLGIVGPDSYAKEVQEFVHQAINGQRPDGWDNQLKDEPVIDILYEAKKKVAKSNIANGYGYDAIVNTGGGIGNALTYYDLGLSFRTGWNVPDDFGNYPIRPISTINTALGAGNGRLLNGHRYGLYLFLSANCRLVLHNILLDGNTFQNSHSVDKNPVVGRFVSGVGFVTGRINASFAFVLETKEFKTQDRPQHYGSINISFVY